MLSLRRCEVDNDFVKDFPVPMSRAAMAWRDLVEGASGSWMWTALALQDIKLRYRGSVLGPWWLTLTTLVMALTMGVIYAHLLNINIEAYLPYPAIGLVIWQFISGMVTDGCKTFVRAEAIIREVPIPFSIHAYRAVCRNLIILAHNFVIPLAFITIQMSIGWRVVEALAAVATLAVNGLWVSILLGMVSARFRDVPPIVASCLQVGFFLTPIFWPIKALGGWAKIAALNPLFAAVDIVRAPLLDVPAEATSWLVVLGSTILGWTITYGLFAQFRMRIAYWI
jgi:ABC-type polysaccharide/polyol phosphate export permease